MSRISDQAIIVRSRPYSETSLLLDVLTHNHGLIRLIAKGVCKPGHKLHGQLDDYCQGTLHWSASRSSQLHTLTSFELQHSHQGLTQSYARSLAAAYFYDLIRMMTEPAHPVPELYVLFQSALSYLEKNEPTHRLVERYEHRVFAYLGLLRPGLPPTLQRESAIPSCPPSGKRLFQLLQSKLT